MSSNTKSRVCVKHGKQPLSAYYIYKTKEGNGFRTRYQCKACDKLKTQQHRKKDPDWWREYGRKWRAKNKKKCAKYQQQHKLEAMTHVFSYLQLHPCVDCGERDPCVLEFDHVRGTKHQNISVMVQGRYAISRIQEEIEKCAVRCANCHRRKTITQFSFYQYLDPKLLLPLKKTS